MITDQIEAVVDEDRGGLWHLVVCFSAYIEALKPRETLLLTFIGIATSILAFGGIPAALPLLGTLMSILLASAGVNGLTCYLDREWDARMARTRSRPLPSGRISPAEKLLPFTIFLTVAGLTVGYAIHPLVAAAGAIGTATALIARKTWITHYLGIASSLAPVWMGWLAFNRQIDQTLISISAMVAVWVLIHVWSLMLAYRDDYLQAGLRIFPVTVEARTSAKWLLFLSWLLAGTTYLIYISGRFGIAYAAAAAVLSPVVVLAGFALVYSRNEKAAWLLYKFSAFPFLGLIFTAMAFDRLLFS